VTTVHGFTGGNFRNRLYEWVQRRAIRRCDAVVAVARSLVRSLLQDGVPADRMHLVINAWRPSVIPLNRDVARQFLGAVEDEFAIGWVGRLSHEKGLDILLRALPSLGSVPFRLHVIGHGRERTALEAIARNIGIDDRIVWHGVIPNAERLFAGFDAFVLSSRTEGTPIVLLEAMAASVPVVATRVGGIPDVVSEREAMLVAGLDPHELATALNTVFADPGAASRRARAAKLRLAAEYRERSWVERYQLVYDAARANVAVKA
jgi:glycosyltransferase involved in cell wall biosynthesis